MKDNSPNSLKPQPKAKQLSKNYLYFIFGALGLLFAVLIYSVNFAHVQDEVATSSEVEIIEEEQSLFVADGSGLALKDKETQTSGIITPATEPVVTAQEVQAQHREFEPIVVLREEPQPRVNEDAEQMRRLRMQEYLEALKAPLLSKKNTSENNNQNQAYANTSGVVPQQVSYAGIAEALNSANAGNGLSGYDPSASRDKEDFFNRAQSDKTWVSEDMRTMGHEFEIKTGAVIPGVMITGVNSDLPGTIIGQVSQNVYDTATGMNLLIPQGSKLFGAYDSRVVFGQERVLVAWNRIIYPDGSAITLPSMPGADISGYAGYNDKVDNHYFRIFGSAILMSLITGGTAYAVDLAGGGGESGTSDETSLQSQMTASLAQQLGQTSATLLEKNLSIAPTLEIRPGYRFNIILTKDLVFENPYSAWR